MGMDKFLHSFIFLSAALGICLSPLLNQEAQAAKSIPFHLQQKEGDGKLKPGELSRSVEGLLFEASNQARLRKKLPPLESEDILVKAARDHSQDMLRRNYLSHFSPEKKSVVDRVKKYQPKLERSVGENLHTISSSQGLVDARAISAQMMEDWMDSSSHRKNILAKDYRFLGVGCASDGQTIFCTQVFAGPASR